MSGLRLTATQRRRLEHQLRATQDAGLFRRTLAILEAAGGRPIAESARLLRTSRRSDRFDYQAVEWTVPPAPGTPGTLG